MKCLTALLLVFLTATAQADVYRCVENNRDVYQDYPCSGSAGGLVMRTGDGTSAAAPALSAGSPVGAPLTWILLASLAMSLFCYYVYWYDKRAAVDGERRVPERTLHALALLGGWPGALVAQYALHHKTRKISFQLVFWLIVLLHLSLWADYLSHGALHRALFLR